ncbi:hypothetical protein [Saccharopolyspora pogona]|uniref:hypothetical protein n=1 Tax=Saccharopolyspora pogona TaxID=333966 RepID=UPI0016837220|nr:hypothetical protein [Saccharopolyspora pogona]
MGVDYVAAPPVARRHEHLAPPRGGLHVVDITLGDVGGSQPGAGPRAGAMGRSRTEPQGMGMAESRR